MKRRIPLIAILIIVFVMMLSGCKQNAYEYKKYEDGYVMTGYHGSETDITVPLEYDGKPVYGTEGTKEQPVFRSDKITSISYPGGLTTFGAYSVADCKNLESILLAQSVIGKDNAIVDSPKAEVCCEAFFPSSSWGKNWNIQNNRVTWHSTQGAPEGEVLMGMVSSVEKDILEMEMNKPCATISRPIDSNDEEYYNAYNTLIYMSTDEIKNLRPGQFVEFFLAKDPIHGYICYEVNKTDWSEPKIDGTITNIMYVDSDLKNPKGMFATISGDAKKGDNNTYYAFVETAGMSVNAINELNRGDIVEFNYRKDKTQGNYVCYNVEKQG